MKGNRTYFASDFHLGLAAGTDPREREARVVAWLEKASRDAHTIYLLGDIFDFWWEYKHVIPKGFTRFLGKLASITDSGIPVHVFTGNHDLWMKDYLVQECGVVMHHKPFITKIGDEEFYLAHGEGLGSTNRGFKIILGIFNNKFLQHCYSALHPAIGIGFGHAWSRSSRLAKHISLPFMGGDREDLIRHTRRMVSEGCGARYYIYGHRHLPMTFDENGKRIIILGDWFSLDSYAVYDGSELTLVNEPLNP
ncbi:MAG TPA: UDP-2,3-diacylglucosamine diphosphatase [Bacteroidales bacterium]|nr:UDP-2,3-diacylglucosamine diphosphatase [Bacteroidales bacterium]